MSEPRLWIIRVEIPTVTQDGDMPDIKHLEAALSRQFGGAYRLEIEELLQEGEDHE